MPFELPPHYSIVLLNAEVDFVAKKAVRGPDVEIDAQILSGHIQARFAGQVRGWDQACRAGEHAPG